MKQYTLWSAAFDLIMLVLTGGFWAIWVVVRYLRTHQKATAFFFILASNTYSIMKRQQRSDTKQVP